MLATFHRLWTLPTGRTTRCFGSKGPTYGFEATLNNYLKSYASPEEMGQLRFELWNGKRLARSTVFARELGLGPSDELEDLSGHFTLTWELKPDAGWVIIADHSS